MRRQSSSARVRIRRSRARSGNNEVTIRSGERLSRWRAACVPLLVMSLCLAAGCHLIDRSTTVDQGIEPSTKTTSDNHAPPERLPALDKEANTTEASGETRLVQYELSDPEVLPAPEDENDSREEVQASPLKKLPGDLTEPGSRPFDLATPSMSMVIEDCRAAALQGNLDLRIVQVDPQITSQGIRAQNWKFEPFLSGTVSRNEVVSQPGNVLFGPPRLVESVQPAINFPTPTGGTVSILDVNNRFDFIPGGVVPGFPVYDTAFGMSISQPLLRGGWFPTNLASIRVARLENATADAQVRLTSVIVLVTIETAYWQVYAAQQQVKIAEQQLDYARQQLAIAKRLADEKIVARIEVLRAESGVALRREALIVAMTEVKLRSRDLKQAMQRPDLPVDSPVEIVPATPPSPFDVRLDRNVLGGFALANRMELQQNGYALDINDQAIVVARNGILPNIQLQFITRLLGTGDSFSAANNQLQTGNFHDSFLGFTGQIPLAANQTARARWQQALLTKSRTLVVRRQLEVTILKQVNDAVDRLEQNWQRVEAARKSVDAADKTYRAERRLFELGQRAGDLVLDAATRLAIAQNQEVLATTDFMLARAELAFATGSMLGYGGIVWDDQAPPAPAR